MVIFDYILVTSSDSTTDLSLVYCNKITTNGQILFVLFLFSRSVGQMAAAELTEGLYCGQIQVTIWSFAA